MIIRLYLTSEMAERALSEKRESMKETRPTSRWQTRQSDRELGNMSQSRRPARYPFIHIVLIYVHVHVHVHVHETARARQRGQRRADADSSCRDSIAV